MTLRWVLSRLSCVCILILTASYARAQFTPLDQTRYLSTLATGPAGPNQQFSNTVTNSGAYIDSETASKDFTDTTRTTLEGNPEYHAHGMASQNSNVSSTGFTAVGSTGADAYMIPSGDLGATVEGNGQSGYTVDFTVAAETPFAINGNLAASAMYHLGPLEALHTSLLLSGSTSGNLYSVGGNYNSTPQGPMSFSVPISFFTMLEPGQTYTLTALASVDSKRIGTSGSPRLDTPGLASFNFVATVPDPASISTLCICGMWILSHQRSRHRS